MLRDTTFPDLHNAVLEACRDVAPSRVAAEALVAAGAVPQVAHILMHNVSQSHEQGRYGCLACHVACRLIMRCMRPELG